MIKVLTVMGTRPEVIKLAPVVHELRGDPETFRPVVLVTGQHREMLDPMLDLFGIEVDHDLDVMRSAQTPEEVFQGVLEGMRPVLDEECPDWVLVQGDTTSVMAASLAAFYARARLGHVEAGLRTFDKYSPFPEEVNRRVAGVLADLHFAPTAWARSNLLREGVPARHVRLTGNTVIDALLHVGGLGLDLGSTPLAGLPLDKRLILVTSHRNENLGARLESIVAGIRELARQREDVHFVYPVHLNPKARGPAERQLRGLENVTVTNPLGYQEMVWLLRRAYLVLTDSGGLQEEAAGVGTPVLVMRDTTERPEGIQSGIAKLIDPGFHGVVENVPRMLDDELEYLRMSSADCPYGDGRAARRIVDALAGRAAGMDDHIYERPLPEHPLDALLREATAGIPPHYADQVLARARRRAGGIPSGTYG